MERLGPGADLRGGGGCWVVLLAMVHGCVGKDTLLTGSNFRSELKIEDYDIEIILLVRSCSLLARRTGGSGLSCQVAAT